MLLSVAYTDFQGGGAEQHINETHKGVTIVGTKRVNF